MAQVRVWGTPARCVPAELAAGLPPATWLPGGTVGHPRLMAQQKIGIRNASPASAAGSPRNRSPSQPLSRFLQEELLGWPVHRPLLCLPGDSVVWGSIFFGGGSIFDTPPQAWRPSSDVVRPPPPINNCPGLFGRVWVHLQVAYVHPSPPVSQPFSGAPTGSPEGPALPPQRAGTGGSSVAVSAATSS